MIWSDRDIQNGLNDGRINIDPFNPINVQPASYDCTLGNVFLRFQYPYSMIDPKDPTTNMEMEKIVTDSFILQPKTLILGMTAEKLTLCGNVIARVEGKSSLARLGIAVHATAGFIDPGNSNLNITLELYNMGPHPIKLYRDMKICQLAFQDTLSPCKVPYGPMRNSRYYANSEPVASRIGDNL